MPYRVLFRLIAARLEATRRDTPEGYAGADEVERDLGMVIASLRAHRGEHAGLFGVQRLLRRVETFGFHLATIDVRQHALVHRAVLATLLRDREWSTRTAADRLARLRRVLEKGDEPAGSPDAQATRTLEVFQAIADCRARFARRPEIFEMCGFTFSGEQYIMRDVEKQIWKLPGKKKIVGLNTGCGGRWTSRLSSKP